MIPANGGIVSVLQNVKASRIPQTYILNILKKGYLLHENIVRSF